MYSMCLLEFTTLLGMWEIMDLPLHRTRPDSQTEFEVSCNRPPFDRNEGRASKRDLRIVCESVQLLPNCWVRYVQLEHNFLDRLLNGNHTSQHFDLQTSISDYPWFFTLHFHLYMIKSASPKRLSAFIEISNHVYGNKAPVGTLSKLTGPVFKTIGQSREWASKPQRKSLTEQP